MSRARTWRSNIAGPRVNIDRLPALAADLVRRQCRRDRRDRSTAAALAAKAATTTIPIVFVIGGDPVRVRPCRQPRRPGGNLTGINFLNTELAAKRLELLRELVPAATRVAVLVNPANADECRDHIERRGSRCSRHRAANPSLNASTSREIDAAFATSCARATRRPLSSAPTASSTAGVSSWPIWRRATRSPRPMQRANMPKPAG